MVIRTSVLPLVLIGAGTLLWMTGCAASGEHAARMRWRDAHSRQREATQIHETAIPDLGESTSLDEILALAEARNPGLQAAFDRWTAALEQVPQARSLPDPRASYAYFIEPVETRVGPQRQRFGVSQTIPLFGKLGLRGAVATQAANAASAQFEAVRRDLRFRVTEKWNDYYYLNRAIAVTDENLRLLSNLESVALTQYTSGRASHSAIVRVQVELGRLEDRLRTLRDQRAPILAALNAELNLPETSAIAWPESIVTAPLRLSQVELRELLLKENPRLLALSYMKEQQAAASRLAARNPFPDLTIGAEYIDTGEARFPNVPDSGKNAAVANAMINIPLWFGRYSAEKSQAQARLSATENEYTQLRNRLLADLERIQFELRDAERRVDLYAYTLLPKAHESFEVTEDAFTTGEAGFLDLIDAQRTLLEFGLAYERALADRATRRAQIEQIVGTDLEADD